MSLKGVRSCDIGSPPPLLLTGGGLSCPLACGLGITHIFPHPSLGSVQLGGSSAAAFAHSGLPAPERKELQHALTMRRTADANGADAYIWSFRQY
jgi:hypothetical protein